MCEKKESENKGSGEQSLGVVVEFVFLCLERKKALKRKGGAELFF